MDIIRKREQLRGILTYMLGRNPAEFGLVLNDDGYVKIKEVLHALTEEDGWGFVKQGNITELVVALTDPGIEITDDLIRAENRTNLIKPLFMDALPKLLYTGIRKNAHFHVSDNGIKPYDNKTHVILSSERDMAERIARRKDNEPVILTINTHDAEQSGVLFLYAGETLFLAKDIPSSCFSGPPLPNPDKDKEWVTNKKKPAPKTPPEPGSFYPVFGKTAKGSKQKPGKEDRMSWKHNKKKLRKQQERYRGEY